MSDIKRVRYFNGEFLVADDFNADQDYHRQMRYRHNKDFHSWGIVTGLEVTWNPGEKLVTISPGLAVDKEGKEIVLQGSGTVDFDTEDFVGSGIYYITIAWNQAASDPNENGEAKRYDETPVIAVSQDAPLEPDVTLILARVALNPDKSINISDSSGRTASSIDIGNDSVTSIKIAEADGVSGQNTDSGTGVKTGHIQDGAVTAAKLAAAVSSKLVTDGNTHDHTAGNGGQVRHSSLKMDDGVNPHDVAMSQLTDLNANNGNIINLADPTQNNHAANKAYVDGKTGGTISSASNITTVTPAHTRQVNVSYNSTVSNSYSQVNASYNSTASGYESQVNASYNSNATNYRCQVNASYGSSASDYGAQVNASTSSNQNGQYAQITSSLRVTNNSNYTLCGGYASSGDPSAANRKWQINSSNGYVYIAGSLNSSYTFGDYGEYFENLKKGEIDIGVLIALDGAKVRQAKKDEDFIGVVSATAGIRLGDTPFCWQGRFLYDEWGRQVFEEIKDPDWEPKKVPDEKWKPKKGQTEADRPMIAVETEKDRPFIRVQKENPNYDPKKKQKPRSERPDEWTLVGLLGQVFVRCDKTVKPGNFVKSGNKGIGTKADEKTKLRAMKVTKEFDGKYAIVYCLLN